MKYSRPGLSTSNVEVTNISVHGFWILLDEKEYFLSYLHFPWFEKASVEKICDVKIINEQHLYWTKLDINLELSSITNPENYPLVFK